MLRRILLSGLAAAALLIGVSVTAEATYDESSCSKECGYATELDRGTRSGCQFEGNTCYWVKCSMSTTACIEAFGSNAPYNDDCDGYESCIPNPEPLLHE